MWMTIMLACALGAPGGGKAQERSWWVFIEHTKVQAMLSQAESEEMMKAHLGNSRRLYDLKRLTVAGPMRDPGGTRRGIVLLTVKSRRDVDESFKPDPFFQHGIFTAHVVPLKPDFGEVLRVTGADADSIEENRLVVLERLENGALPKQPAGTPHRDAIRDGASAGLAFHAVATSGDAVREIALFRGTDDKKIQAWLDGDPWVKSGRWKATVYPQWLARNCLPQNPTPVAVK